MELGLSNIRANAILPGVVKGDRMERVLKAEAEAEGISVEEARERAVRSTSMRAMIDPVEIADLAIFLSSDAGRHISGQAIGICGNQETLAT
jgi:NAD(P)-dependent dehydrogenase (short-subunit alcohol dehydrogenase family)